MTNEPGRGKKQCPDCEKYVGVRTSKCTCGHEFSTKTKKEKSTSKPETEFMIGLGWTNITIPSGKCPAQLQNTEQETVQNWAHKILEAGRKKNVSYAVSALKYFVREFYVIFSEDYEKVCNHLDTIFGESSPCDTEGV